jgi:hypothetical protein
MHAHAQYFEEDLGDCIALVDEVLDQYKSILANADEKQKKFVMESWGLKLEQLKGELQQLLDQHDH